MRATPTNADHASDNSEGGTRRPVLNWTNSQTQADARKSDATAVVIVPGRVGCPIAAGDFVQSREARIASSTRTNAANRAVGERDEDRAREYAREDQRQIFRGLRDGDDPGGDRDPEPDRRRTDAGDPGQRTERGRRLGRQHAPLRERIAGIVLARM